MLATIIALCYVGCGNENETDKNPPIENFTVKYIAYENGSIIGEITQIVRKGQDGKEVTAVGDEGWEFSIWSDNVNSATRQEKNVQEDIVVCAWFEKAYKVKYLSSDMGYIDGNAEQTVIWDRFSEEVTAVANEGYEFYCWTDGLKTATRKDGGFSKDFEVTALFKTKEYNVHYILQEGGYFVEGEEYHSIPHGSYTPPIFVDALPYYNFLGWSDGVKTKYRQERITSDFEVTALFEKLEVPVSYGVNIGGRIDGDVNQNVIIGEAATSVTAIPDEGYEFLGWTDGVKTATRHDTNIRHNVHVNANFAPVGAVKYNVLMVFVTRLQAELKTNIEAESENADRCVTVDYSMSEAEWQIYDRVTINLSDCLNDIFDGKVWFIFESCFTSELVGIDSMRHTFDRGYTNWDIETSWIPELENSGKLRHYDTVMTTFCMDDYDNELHVVAGYAWKKYGYVHTETLTSSMVCNNYKISMLVDILDDKNHPDYNYWVDSCNVFYLHEFAHTCELWINDGTVSLHGVVSYYEELDNYSFKELDILRKFFLCEAEVNGKKTGIPPTYWEYNYERQNYQKQRLLT